jgi:hypothetical protein
MHQELVDCFLAETLSDFLVDQPISQSDVFYVHERDLLRVFFIKLWYVAIHEFPHLLVKHLPSCDLFNSTENSPVLSKGWLAEGFDDQFDGRELNSIQVVQVIGLIGHL